MSPTGSVTRLRGSGRIKRRANLGRKQSTLEIQLTDFLKNRFSFPQTITGIHKKGKHHSWVPWTFIIKIQIAPAPKWHHCNRKAPVKYLVSDVSKYLIFGWLAVLISSKASGIIHTNSVRPEEFIWRWAVRSNIFFQVTLKTALLLFQDQQLQSIKSCSKRLLHEDYNKAGLKSPKCTTGTTLV